MRQVGHARALLKRGCNVLQVISKEQPKGITGADMCAFVDRCLLLYLLCSVLYLCLVCVPWVTGSF